MRRAAAREPAGRLDFGKPTSAAGLGPWQGLRLAASGLRGPEKYKLLDVKRRRAQIRARRALGLI